jgi:hypothetical protein
MSEPEITVRKMSWPMPPLSQEAIDDMAGMPNLFELMEQWEAEAAAFRALPVEEQARILAEQAAKAEAERLERTCPHCGCDPQEHGN